MGHSACRAGSATYHLSDSSDLTLAVVALDNLPALEEIVPHIQRSTWRRLHPSLERMPLLNVLNEILILASHSEEPQGRALLDLARLAVAKHAYTRSLYAQLIDATKNFGAQENGPMLPDLPETDARLAMEMLALIADLLAAHNLHEIGVRTFEIAKTIAERFQLIANKGITYQQLGLYELKRAQFAKAEAALKIASQIFAQVAPGLKKQTDFQRALVFKLRLENEENVTAPDDFDQILAADPKARNMVLLAQAKVAVDGDDLAAANTLLERLPKVQSEYEDVSGEELLVRARLARRQGDFEKAELLLKRSAEISRGPVSTEIAWQQYYLARDLGHTEESQALLEQLKDEHNEVRVGYQKALVAYNAGDHKTAEKYLRSCLRDSESEKARADCLGTLALITEDQVEARRFLHEAIGLYVKLNCRLDHAICLSHLAIMEIGEGVLKKQSGWPRETISQFRQADSLLQRAQEIAESLAAFSFMLDIIVNRARLEMARERYNAALGYFEQAATSLEVTYLSMTDRNSANRFLTSYTSFYKIAIDCALLAGNTDVAVLFSERSKARRFLRDAAQTTYEGDAGSTHALAARERQLLAEIQPLRNRVIQQRSLTLAERQALYDAEQELRSLWREMRQTPEAPKRVHQPVEVGVLRQLVYAELGKVTLGG